MIKSTKLATAITGTCARRRQVFIRHPDLDHLGPSIRFAEPYLSSETFAWEVPVTAQLGTAPAA